MFSNVVFPKIIKDDDLCFICMDKEKCKSFGCKICKNSVCLECFKLISQDYFDDENKEIILNYICPVCRADEEYTYNDFTKDDIINIANSHITDLKKLIDKYTNNLEDLVKIRIIKKTEEYNNNIQTLKKNLRYICERDNNKTIRKFLIEPLYNRDY